MRELVSSCIIDSICINSYFMFNVWCILACNIHLTHFTLISFVLPHEKRQCMNKRQQNTTKWIFVFRLLIYIFLALIFQLKCFKIFPIVFSFEWWKQEAHLLVNIQSLMHRRGKTTLHFIDAIGNGNQWGNEWSTIFVFECIQQNCGRLCLISFFLHVAT